MSTTVYQYIKGVQTPKHEIISTWKNGRVGFEYVEYPLASKAKPLATSLYREYNKHQRFKLYITLVAEKYDVIMGAAAFLRELKISTEIETDAPFNNFRLKLRMEKL